MDIKKVCSECGSGAVFANACASWNFNRQEWGLESLLDSGGFCSNCDDECEIVDEN